MKPNPILRAMLMAGLLCGSSACQKDKTPDPIQPKVRLTLGTIERIDPALDQLLAKDAKVEVLAEYFEWSEGPVWIASEKHLLFSDVPKNVVYKLSPGKGVSDYLRPSGYTGAAPRGGEPGSNGLTLDAQGRLVLCEHGDRRVARLEKDGKTKTTIADKYEGKRFNSPNDLCYSSKGNLYFTDPPYGLVGNMKDPAKELDFQGVYMVSPAGKVTLLTKELSRPNGVALSPDEKTLYVAVSDPADAKIWSFDVKDDGTIGAGKVFFDTTPMVVKKQPGLPDGLKVDVKGNLWATGPGGVLILSSTGKHLGTINTGEPTANCAWGDDGATLYITANHWICRIKTLTSGKMPG